MYVRHYGSGEGVQGTIYLLHFDRPFGHAKHYTGWTGNGDIDRRIDAHRRGEGARLLAVMRRVPIGFVLARTWQGDRHRERRLKRQGGASRRCPICRGNGFRMRS